MPASSTATPNGVFSLAVVASLAASPSKPASPVPATMLMQSVHAWPSHPYPLLHAHLYPVRGAGSSTQVSSEFFIPTHASVLPTQPSTPVAVEVTRCSSSSSSRPSLVGCLQLQVLYGAPFTKEQQKQALHTVCKYNRCSITVPVELSRTS